MKLLLVAQFAPDRRASSAYLMAPLAQAVGKILLQVQLCRRAVLVAGLAAQHRLVGLVIEGNIAVRSPERHHIGSCCNTGGR